MRQSKSRLDDHDIAVVVVVFAGQDAARDYARETGTDWPIVVDSSRELYRQYGMGQAGFGQIWSLKTLKSYARLLLAGRRLRLARGQDTRQLGGDVLVDPNGRVQMCHVSTGPSDRPSVSSILRAAR
ncbi:MAG: hypothetical protein KJO07_07365 [Deltaproteobacteria bacterium]|nr:hypothetical protein [Deltaproteobacteria bacterium]